MSKLIVHRKPSKDTATLAIGGRVKLSVIDQDGNTIQEGPWINNLVLDQGLDNFATVLFADLFAYCAVGTGTLATRRVGAGNASMVNGDPTITLSSAEFTNADVGRLIEWTSGADDGYTATILSVTDSTHAEAEETPTQNIAAGTYRIHNVEQVGLSAETKRSGDYSVAAGNNGTTTATNTKTLKRTFLFSAEAAPVTYKEVGFSHIDVAGTNLNIRIDIAGAGEITVALAQRLKVTYEFKIKVEPDTTQNGAVTITDSDLMSVNKNASWVIEKFAVSIVDTNGNTDASSTDLEPSNASSAGFSSDTAALSPLTGSLQRNNNVSVVAMNEEAAYVPGSFEQFYTGVFDLEDANRSDLRSLMVYQADSGYAVFTILFNNNQAKDSNHALTVRFRKSWDRILP